MGIAAVVHSHVFPAKPYRRGERCVRNVAVMSDYASLGAPPDPEEISDGGRLTRMRIARPDDRERRLSFQQSVRDVFFGSGEIVGVSLCFMSSLNFLYQISINSLVFVLPARWSMMLNLLFLMWWNQWSEVLQG